VKTPDRTFRPRLHILVCTNQRPPDATLPCCASAHGLAVADALRQAVQRSPFRGQIWVTQTGCLTFCNARGATVVAYPSGLWFTEVTLEDIPDLLLKVTHPNPTASFPI